MNAPFQFPDSLEMMKQFWGSWTDCLNATGIMGPTLDLQEIERRIKDLKTVEHWLNVNLTMLHTTIHALEVQKDTLATLQAIGQQFEKATAQGNAAHNEQDETKSSSIAWWELLQKQYVTMAQSAQDILKKSAVAASASEEVKPSTKSARKTTPRSKSTKL